MANRGRKTKKLNTPKAEDQKGYLDSNKDKFTDYKVIKGNKITMEGVSGKIYAIPIDSKGNAGQGRLLKPGENHEFEGAAHVVEVPEVAMAQFGLNTGGFNQQKMEQMGIVTAFPNNTTYGGTVEPAAPDYLSMSPEEFKAAITPPVVTPPPTSEPAQPEQRAEVSTVLDPEYVKQVGKKPTAEELLQESASNATDELEERYEAANREVPEGNELEPTQKIQFDNPYGGVDIPTAAQTLGASFSYDGDQKGMNTARGVASGLKLLTGLGRNIMSGYAQNKRDQWVIDEENRKQKNQLKGNVQYLQKGGQVKAAELLTGAYATGDPEAPHNVEVEGGEHIKDNQTGKVQEVLGNKHSQGGERMNLEDHKVLSDYTEIGGELASKYQDEFGIKVKAKDSYATVMDKVLKKTGYKSITDELTEVIEKTEKEQEAAKNRDSEATTGINMQYLSGKINELNTELEPLEQMKSNVFETLFNDQQSNKSKSEVEAEMTEAPEMQDGGFTKEDSRERFREWIRTLRAAGFEGEVNPNADDLGAEAGKVQRWMRNNKPDAVIQYFTETGQPITAKGIDLIKSNNPEVFEKAGIDASRPSASYTDEEKAALTSIMKEDGTYTDDFILEQFNDDKFLFRAPLVTTPLKAGEIQPFKGSGITAELMADPNRRPVETGTVPSGTPNTEEEEGENRGNGRRTALLPDQHILPPSTMQPHRLAEITPRETEAKLISPDAQIEEINRQAMAARESINSLPDSQRRAALAQLNAQTQQSINQVMSQTNRANAQIEGQNEQANATVANNAEVYNENAANVHERNMLLAKDNTETDIRNYFNAMNKKQIANYNTINNMNLTNAMYDNFQYDGNGSIIQTGKGLSQDDAKARLLASMGLTEADLEEAKKKKTKTAKRGRRIK